MRHDENLCLAVQLDLLRQGHLLYGGNPEPSTRLHNSRLAVTWSTSCLTLPIKVLQ